MIYSPRDPERHRRLTEALRPYWDAFGRDAEAALMADLLVGDDPCREIQLGYAAANAEVVIRTGRLSREQRNFAESRRQIGVPL